MVLRQSHAPEEAVRLSYPKDWLVVIEPEGKVVAVDGGPPANWIGNQIDHCAGVPEDVLAAARDLSKWIPGPRPAMARRTTVISPERPDIAFTLVLVHAVFLQCTEVELLPLLRGLLEPMEKQAAAAFISLAFDVDPGCPRTLVVDGNKIGWAVATLVGNALRHVEPGTREAPGGHVRVRLHYNALQRRVVITVADNGVGIQAGVRAWLFESKPGVATSAGVALKLVGEVVAAHGGGMTVTRAEPKKGRGTEVTFWLPESH